MHWLFRRQTTTYYLALTTETNIWYMEQQRVNADLNYFFFFFVCEYMNFESCHSTRVVVFSFRFNSFRHYFFLLLPFAIFKENSSTPPKGKWINAMITYMYHNITHSPLPNKHVPGVRNKRKKRTTKCTHQHFYNK